MGRLSGTQNANYGRTTSMFGGDSGAGKHTLANDMKTLFGVTLSVVDGDDDHRWERGHAMWRRYTHLDPRATGTACR